MFHFGNFLCWCVLATDFKTFSCFPISEPRQSGVAVEPAAESGGASVRRWKRKSAEPCGGTGNCRGPSFQDTRPQHSPQHRCHASSSAGLGHVLRSLSQRKIHGCSWGEPFNIYSDHFKYFRDGNTVITINPKCKQAVSEELMDRLGPAIAAVVELCTRICLEKWVRK